MAIKVSRGAAGVKAVDEGAAVIAARVVQGVRLGHTARCNGWRRLHVARDVAAADDGKVEHGAGGEGNLQEPLAAKEHGLVVGV